VQLWLRRVITHCGQLLDSAGRLIRDGDYMSASVEILRAAYQRLPAGAYAVWRTVPQSSGRGVTRFLAAAKRAGVASVAGMYLAAARLEEDATWERFSAVPSEGRQARDLDWTVRRGAGEDVDELSATRDILKISLWATVIQDHSQGARPKWTGATSDAGQVRSQYDGARAFLEWLRKH